MERVGSLEKLSRTGSALWRMWRQELFPPQCVKIKFYWESRHADTTTGQQICLPFTTSLTCRAKTYSGFHLSAAVEGRKGEE